MLLGGPPGHVEPDLGDHLEGRGGIDPIDPGEIDAGEAMEVLANIQAGCGSSGLPRAGRGGQDLAPALVFEPQELRLDLVVAGADLRLVELDEFQSLPEFEEVLRAPITLQGAGDRRRVGLAAGGRAASPRVHSDGSGDRRRSRRYEFSCELKGTQLPPIGGSCDSES
jgi:hypothetical protein